MLVAGEGVHAILWPPGTLQGAKLQSDETPRFYRPEAESQVSTIRLELLNLCYVPLIIIG